MGVPAGCPLNQGQFDVFGLLIEGLVVKQIAERLGRSASAIRSRLHFAYEALGVLNANQALVRLVHEGWLGRDQMVLGYRGGAYGLDRMQRAVSWVPTPGQRLYLDAFDGLLRDRSRVAERRVSVFFGTLCFERGAKAPVRAGHSVDDMLERLARVLLAPSWETAGPG